MKELVDHSFELSVREVSQQGRFTSTTRALVTSSTDLLTCSQEGAGKSGK
jgi:hypothetical protein